MERSRHRLEARATPDVLLLDDLVYRRLDVVLHRVAEVLSWFSLEVFEVPARPSYHDLGGSLREWPLDEDVWVVASVAEAPDALESRKRLAWDPDPGERKWDLLLGRESCRDPSVDPLLRLPLLKTGTLRTHSFFHSGYRGFRCYPRWSPG